MTSLFRRLIPTKNDRELKRIQPLVARINALEPELEKLTFDELAARTPAFRDRLANGERLDDLLPEAFAVCREASKRILGMRHFDVQLIGGIILHEGRIAEMKTGEGKTLVATLPVYLNALTGKGVHVVTVNDYLASRDAEWMGRLYRALGLTVGVIKHGLDDNQRRIAYGCDVTYGQNNEFGFDYLRDNMKFRLEHYVQRQLNYAIVDEVDSILVDEARTPLIISGPSEESTDKYYVANRVIPRLEAESHYTVDEKARTVALTEEGVPAVEALLGSGNLYEPENVELLHCVNQALRAHTLFKRDVDYVVNEGGEVIIVDEFTGRLMPGRRYSDGLHQALEAKEGVKIASENQTLATITFQNYFRMFDKLAGMTGTADTEAAEFHKIYKLDVVVIPTHRPMIRQDFQDVVYRTKKEKDVAVIAEIKDCHERGQPVLVGTISIEDSEHLSKLLKREGVPHHVLNAKQHEREAEIVAQAGRHRAVTISTNMAGRGTDIVLGGNAEILVKHLEDPEERSRRLEEFRVRCAEERDLVLEAGGLHILGTERHESRRIDNQLRGRSGRQGDPGSSRFYLSLEDDLMRIFASDRVSAIMQRLGMEEGEPIEAGIVTRAIANAQKKVEERNFDVRKHLLEYDDVMNKQREVVYSMRRKILSGEGTKDLVLGYVEDLVEHLLERQIPPKTHPEDWSVDAIGEALFAQFGIRVELDLEKLEHATEQALHEHVSKLVLEHYSAREEEIGSELLRLVEQDILLRTIDALWKDHLLSMDHLKEGIHLRSMKQVDPLREYQREGFEYFTALMRQVKADAVGILFRIHVEKPEDVARRQARQQRPPSRITMSRGPSPEAAIQPVAAAGGSPAAASPGASGRNQPPPPPAPRPVTVRNEGPKVGRNDPCPCGSGQKYKKCHGR